MSGAPLPWDGSTLFYGVRTNIRQINHESHRHTKNYLGYSTWWIQRVFMSSGQAVTSTRALKEAAAAAATLSSTRATLDSNSTHTPVVAVFM